METGFLLRHHPEVAGPFGVSREWRPRGSILACGAAGVGGAGGLGFVSPNLLNTGKAGPQVTSPWSHFASNFAWNPDFLFHQGLFLSKFLR